MTTEPARTGAVQGGHGESIAAAVPGSARDVSVTSGGGGEGCT